MLLLVLIVIQRRRDMQILFLIAVGLQKMSYYIAVSFVSTYQNKQSWNCDMESKVSSLHLRNLSPRRIGPPEKEK